MNYIEYDTKNTVLKGAIAKARTDNSVATILDCTGELTNSFYNPETDYALKPFDLCTLNQDGDFIVKDWLNKAVKGEDKKILWIPWSTTEKKVLNKLITTWVNSFLTQCLTLKPDSKRNILFGVNEIESLGKIEMLKHAISEGRKFGLSIVQSVKSVKTYEKVYGDEVYTIKGNSGIC